MKAQLYDIQGNKKKEVQLPPIFESKVREDLAQKLFEAEKFLDMQPYSNDPRGGKKHSASGTISHKRHDWKGHYGRGISRIPRKTMWRRGTQFFWVGAEVSSTRGGRRAHPPKLNKKIRKINKKEYIIAFNSALASTAHKDLVEKRYSTLTKLNIELPIIIESVPDKTKNFLSLLKKILGDSYYLAIKNKKIRAGKGKLRGRKYKSNSGALLVKSKDEGSKLKGLDIKSANQLKISDIYPLGRLAIYTEKAIQELGGKK